MHCIFYGATLVDSSLGVNVFNRIPKLLVDIHLMHSACLRAMMLRSMAHWNDHLKTMSKPQPSPAERTRHINPFRVMSVLERARALERSGADVIHLEVGEPDFPTPEPIVEAGIQALRDGHTTYTPASGLPALRERIAAYYQERYSVTVAPQRVVVTPGASGALVLLAHLLVNPGDQVLMLDPAYPCNRNYVHMVGGQARLLATTTPGQVVPDAAQLNAALTQGPVAGLWLASPANPTGAVLSGEDLHQLTEWTQTQGLHLVVDEIYHGLDYVGGLPTALQYSDTTFVVNSFSKYFGMTGWRLGWVVVPESLTDLANILAQNLFIAAPTPAQYAALRAFDPDVIAVLEARRAAFQQRRDYWCSVLAQLGLPMPWSSDGAFYAYASIANFAEDSEGFCQQLLEQQQVAVTPGTDFGLQGAESHVRFAFTTNLERLEQAAERLARALR